MARKCEICEALGKPAPSVANKMSRLLIEDRIVVLCAAHATRVRERAVSSIDELRGMFREPRGKRALLTRRAPIDRRIFPARPEGRRASSGRRASDP